MAKQGFPKREHLCSIRLIDFLFDKGSKTDYTLTKFPVRITAKRVPRALHQYMQGEQLQIMMSVPKRRLHLAVDRNKVKRQLREAYRKNKINVQEGEYWIAAFSYLANTPHKSQRIHNAVAHLTSDFPK